MLLELCPRDGGLPLFIPGIHMGPFIKQHFDDFYPATAKSAESFCHERRHAIIVSGVDRCAF